MRTSHILLVLLVFLTSVSALMGAYTTIFDQSFNTSTVPTGWNIKGYRGSSHTSIGTLKTNTNLFQTEAGTNYLRLTENTNWHRAWAYYNVAPIAVNGKWRLTADIRIGKNHNGTDASGADGLAFVFLDATTVETAAVLDTSKVSGGYGEWMGAPRGSLPNTPSTGALGYHAGLKGYSFEFDHYKNDTLEFNEYIHWVDISNWQHSGWGQDMGPDTGFYYDNGWEKVQLEANAGSITFSYNWNGSTYNSSYVMNTNSPGNPNCTPMYIYDGYFGICASTGGSSAYHEVKNVKLETDETTLPLEMASFSASPNSYNTATLQWVTYAETNLSGYNLYRGTNEVFNESTNLNVFIDATNSSQPVTYEYIDSDVSAGGSYYYWVQSVDFDGSVNLFGPAYVLIHSDTPTTPGIPVTQGITSIYPNPFSPSTTIMFGIKQANTTSLQIFNARGQIVRSLRQQEYQPGEYSLIWDGKDDSGRACSAGVYTLRMISGTDVSSRRLVIIK